MCSDVGVFVFVFVKRKTAYDMRISDWSSDVCSSDLFVPLPQHRLDGRAEIAVAVSGTLGSPEADGRIALTQGRYENLEMGTILDDLTLLADISKERVTLAELGAVDGAGGKVSGSGELALDPQIGRAHV